MKKKIDISYLFIVLLMSNNIFAEIQINKEISYLRNHISCATLTAHVSDFNENRLLHEIKKEANEQKNKDMYLFLWQSWNLRLMINEELSKLIPCRGTVRELIFKLRGMEDLVGFAFSGVKSQTSAGIDFQKELIPMMEASSNYGFFRKKNDHSSQQAQFESGDLLVTRGASFFSATLSSITENPGDFSHFVLVHKNSNDQTVETMESYAQSGGVGIFSIDFALKNENARILHLRPRFTQIAKSGAEIMYQKFLKQKNGNEKRTKYDFAMNLKNPKSMTCSEIAYWAFYQASQGSIKIPESSSQVSEKLNPILDMAGITKGPMLSPADMEVDSRFELLGEFKDYRLVADSRMRDAILRNIFGWIKTKNYGLHHDLSSFFLTYLIHPISKTPLW
ncbi:MAG: hypothetical protein L6Q37_13760, partial [Bdellovibrionaceae bacterium]|nr:hypothetical protein [Pseudobdellovibrionaceae bacterium]